MKRPRNPYGLYLSDFECPEKRELIHMLNWLNTKNVSISLDAICDIEKRAAQKSQPASVSR
jgi:hypothetical protein